MFISRRPGSRLLLRHPAITTTTAAVLSSSRISVTIVALRSSGAMQLRARTTTTIPSSSTAVAIKAEIRTTTRSPRVKCPSQAESLSTSTATASLRTTKRRAVTLAYDHDDTMKIEFKDEPGLGSTAVDNASPVADAAKKVKKKRVSKTEEMRVKREQPAQWEAMLSGIQAMRATRKAEVDTMGCEMFESDKSPPHVWRFHTLVSAMLSSQTKDPVNAAAMERLIAREGGLTVQTMLDIDETELAQVIHPVGFYRNKARYIKQVASILKNRASELNEEKQEEPEVIDIPDTFESLLALPGVGPKMAYLVMDCAWHNVVGICVDTHVHRISNRLGWVKTWNTKNPKSQDPEKTRHVGGNFSAVL